MNSYTYHFPTADIFASLSYTFSEEFFVYKNMHVHEYPFKVISYKGKLASSVITLCHRASVWKLRLFSISTLPIADLIQSHEFKLHLYDNDSPIGISTHNLCLKFLAYISLPFNISTGSLTSISDLTCPRPNSVLPQF